MSPDSIPFVILWLFGRSIEFIDNINSRYGLLLPPQESPAELLHESQLRTPSLPQVHQYTSLTIRTSPSDCLAQLG